MQLRVSRQLGVIFTCMLVVGCAAARGIEGDRGMREEKPPAISLPFEGSLEDVGPFTYAPKAHGDEVMFAPGVKGQSVFIGGTGDWVNVPVDRRVDISTGATLELWVKRDDWINPYRGGSGTQTVATLGAMGIDIPAMGYPQWSIEGYVEQLDAQAGQTPSVKRVRLRSAPGIIRPHVWYHVALVYDGGSAVARLYLNGQLVSEEGNISIPLQRETHALRLGVWSTPANQAFRGNIDEVRLYDYPRTADQVRQSSKQ